jgi:PIN domain nuclease of toxin-antitoxin system
VRVLLDTHAYLWWVTTPDRLSTRAHALLEDPASEVFFSAASAWEIAIKTSQGKLTLDVSIKRLVVEEPSAQQFAPLPVTAAHAVRAAALPLHHRDPFDRMLVAQAQAEDMVILSCDRQVAQYDSEVVW